MRHSRRRGRARARQRLPKSTGGGLALKEPSRPRFGAGFAPGALYRAGQDPAAACGHGRGDELGAAWRLARRHPAGANAPVRFRPAHVTAGLCLNSPAVSLLSVPRTDPSEPDSALAPTLGVGRKQPYASSPWTRCPVLSPRGVLPAFPSPPPFAPPTPRTSPVVVRRLRRSYAGLTSPVRASSTAPRLPDADQTARGL